MYESLQRDFYPKLIDCDLELKLTAFSMKVILGNFFSLFISDTLYISMDFTELKGFAIMN